MKSKLKLKLSLIFVGVAMFSLAHAATVIKQSTVKPATTTIVNTEEHFVSPNVNIRAEDMKTERELKDLNAMMLEEKEKLVLSREKARQNQRGDTTPEEKISTTMGERIGEQKN